MANDFLPFAGVGGANVLTQSAYAALGARTAGFAAGTAKSIECNKVWRQSSLIASAVAQAISDITGLDMLDDGTTATLIANIKKGLKMSTQVVVGSFRNLAMTVLVAGASATVTADEVVVKTALGGNTFLATTFSKSINLATTGAGGMDTGAAPVNGFVALYAIYNPATDTYALLAKNATAAVQTQVYSGANMPAGYTASALLTVVPTNASSQFKICTVRDRKVAIQLGTFFSFSANIPAQNISIANFVPFNAKEVWGEISASCTATANISVSVSGDNATGQSQQNLSTYIGSVSAVFIGNFANVLMTTPQTVGIGANTTAGTPSFNYYVGGYSL